MRGGASGAVGATNGAERVVPTPLGRRNANLPRKG